MISGIHINMITEVHMAVIVNPLDWWFNLGATACLQQQGVIQDL